MFLSAIFIVMDAVSLAARFLTGVFARKYRLLTTSFALTGESARSNGVALAAA